MKNIQISQSAHRQFKVSIESIDSTIGQFFGIEWEKKNGNLRLANGHVVALLDDKGNHANDGKTHQMIISDNNARTNNNPQGIVTVNLSRVNYVKTGGVTWGKSLMRGRKHDPVQAVGNVR